MSEPRFVTAAEIEGQVIPVGGTTDQVLAKRSNTNFDLKWATGGGGGGGSMLIADETFTDAEIKGATSTPLIVIPATETLNYEGFPTSLPLVLKGYVLLDASSGGYTNVATPPPVFTLVIGSDWSLTAGNAMVIENRETIEPVPFPSGPNKTLFPLLIIEDQVSLTDLQDNAIGIVIPNTDGAFTGGNAANSMRVILYYVNQSFA